MKKLLLLLAILPFLTSCKKNDFDLYKISFPIDITPLSAKYKIREDKAYTDMVLYNTTDENLLFFNGYNFSGSLDDSNSLFENKLSFFKEIKTNQIEAYKILITTSSEAAEFEDMLVDKLGKTDFYYKKTEFTFRIWNVEGKTYFFETNNTGEYNGKKFKSCDLFVVDSKNRFFIDYASAGGFQYYGDYLYEKDKPEKTGKKFTYRDFIDQREKEDGKDSFFLKDYVK